MSDYNITLFEACELLNRSKKSISRYIRAIKSLIRKSIWEVFGNDNIIISGEKHTEIRKEYYQREREIAKNLNCEQLRELI
jgi:hypothetical protein